ncbi:Tagatose-6-phosphate kinase [Vibrio stylophorae]|uniref:Phosphofructokinase n=1 Tax=Vibrio stylophorae TaxID=659351 RepID=A0ABM8ZYW3_9VIBR|nr:1-phosphofructokinase [Vibrio stylophorae]CAH0535548.1 Tagatose-6-phosphate kinase [Vibrio stylophorae]
MSNHCKVVTITLNPALDLTGQLATFHLGAVNKVQTANLRPAGKGVNVAMVLAELGAKVTATGLVGDENHPAFQQLFADYGIEDAFVTITGACRINVKVAEQSGRVSDINFPGVSVSAADIAAFEAKLFALAKTHQVFVMAGSLPPGLSTEVMAGWITRLQAQGKQVIFDSSNEALKAGLDAHPFLVKPNEIELGEFLHQTLDNPAQVQQAAQMLNNQGIENAVVSMGADGVIWQSREACLYAKPPKMNVVSTVGAGDTLVAGLTWGHLQQWPQAQTLKFATTLSALAVSQVGVGIGSEEQRDAIFNQVSVQCIE